MIAQTKGIVIKTINYGESGIIVKIITESFGMQSYMVKGIGSKNTKNKSAFFQPLNLLELVVYHKENKNIQNIKEVQPEYVFQHLHQDVVKRSLLLFVNELLYKSLHDELPNKSLFHWLHHALIWLDLAQHRVADFHLMMMIQLSQFLGFYPKMVKAKAYSVFDLQEGLFGNQLPMHPYYVTGDAVVSLIKLMETTFESNDTALFNNAQRKELLDTLTTYYKLHLPGFSGFKSLEILKMVLG